MNMFLWVCFCFVCVFVCVVVYHFGVCGVALLCSVSMFVYVLFCASVFCEGAFDVCVLGCGVVLLLFVFFGCLKLFKCVCVVVDVFLFRLVSCVVLCC